MLTRFLKRRVSTTVGILILVLASFMVVGAFLASPWLG